MAPADPTAAIIIVTTVLTALLAYDLTKNRRKTPDHPTPKGEPE